MELYKILIKIEVHLLRKFVIGILFELYLMEFETLIDISKIHGK